MKDVERMTEQELDAELRAYGINPDQLMKQAFQKVCGLAIKQGERIATLEAQLAATIRQDAEQRSRDRDAIEAHKQRIAELEAENRYAWEAVTRFCAASEVNAISAYVIERRAHRAAQQTMSEIMNGRGVDNG